MALIAMAVYDTQENERASFTRATLRALANSAALMGHRFFVIDNASCEETKRLLQEKSTGMDFTLITNDQNVGTARAINQAWEKRTPGEVCIKIDNDVVIKDDNWVEQMEQVFQKMPRAGIVGLKRKDLEQHPDHPNLFYKTDLSFMKREKGNPWTLLEKSEDIMGTCVAHSPKLLDAIGFYYQFGEVYGFEDALMSLRSRKAGFFNYFLPSIEIEHIDEGGLPYNKEKEEMAGRALAKYTSLAREYSSGRRPLYHGPQDL